MPQPGQLTRIGGPVDRVSVSLRVFGEDLDPDAVSALLKAQPTQSARKGHVRRGRHHDLVSKRGCWILARDGGPGTSLAVLIDKLLDDVTPDLATWAAVTARYEVDLFCGLFLKEPARGLELPPATLLRVAERGLELGLDIYCATDDDAGDIADAGDAARLGRPL